MWIRSSSSPTLAPSCRNIICDPNALAKPALSLNVSALYNVHIVEALIQLIVESDTEFIANSHCIEDLTYLKVHKSVQASAPQRNTGMKSDV